MIAQKRLDNRTIIVYTFVRYVGLAVLLIKGILLAAFLGPTLFGVWGFLTLLLQYLTYSNFGIQHTVTVELSNKESIDTAENLQLTANALGFSILLCFIITVIGWLVQANNLPMFEKYNVAQYMFLFALTVGLNHVTAVLISINRAYRAIYRIAIFQLIDAILPLTVLWFASGESLIQWLLASMVLSQLIGVALFLVRSSWKLMIALNVSVLGNLIMMGLPLLVYNASFNMITMSGRTILASFYSVEMMGYYSLANSLTNAVLLGLRSIAFVLLPDVINRTHSGLSNEQALDVANKSNNFFGTSAYLLSFSLIIASPYFFRFIPEYQPAQKTIGALMLAQAMLSASFGYNAAALARGNQLQVAKISIFSVAFIGLISLIFAYIRVDIFWIAVSVLLGASVFSFAQNWLTLRLLDNSINGNGFLKNRLLIAGLISSIIFVFMNYLGLELMAIILSPLIFVVINWENIVILIKFGYNVFFNK